MTADRFSLLAGIASDWWWEMDADLRFRFVSDRFEKLFGTAASSLIGLRRTDIPRTDYGSPAWRAHLDDLERRRPFRNFETTVIDAGGVSRPVMISGTPMFGSDGAFEGYIGVGHDLTELRRHEREAKTTAANLESILENIEQGVVLFDRDHRIAAYNRQLAEWLEVGRDVRGLSLKKWCVSSHNVANMGQPIPRLRWPVASSCSVPINVSSSSESSPAAAPCR